MVSKYTEPLESYLWEEDYAKNHLQSVNIIKKLTKIIIIKIIIKKLTKRNS